MSVPIGYARQDVDLDLDLDLDQVLDSARQIEPDLDIEATLQAAEDFARRNLDSRVAEAIAGLSEPSPQRTRRAIDELHREFTGDSILDIARVRKLSELVLPLLEEYEETADLAPWLRTRIDYFDVADLLVMESAALPPDAGTNSPATSATNTVGQVTVQPTPGTNTPVRPASTNQPASRPGTKPRPLPTAARQRTVWERLVAKRAPSAGAEAFASELKPIFTEVGVPTGLVWLAEVESSFNPEATSPVGAVGLFQLMPATARSLGLSTSLPDERRNPAKAARAAATYLRQLHRRFKDWRLALAAYNVGEGRVHRTLVQHKATSFDEIAPHLPAETQMYVPKFEAVLRKHEGIGIDRLPAP